MSDRGSEALFERVLVPVASERDATRARETVIPRVADAGGTVVLVHVVTLNPGGIDPSPAEVQREEAERLFALSTPDGTDVVVDTRTAYGPDVVDALVETVREVDATAVVLAPEERGRLIRLLTGETTRPLMARAPVPIVALPERTPDERSGEGETPDEESSEGVASGEESGEGVASGEESGKGVASGEESDEGETPDERSGEGEASG
jgi:nucleotide-binding universal stress UspA family protein